MFFVGSVQAEPSRNKQRRDHTYITDHDLLRGEVVSVSLVIPMDMECVDVERMLVDIGSSINILYKSVFDKLGVDATKLRPTRMLLERFTSDKVKVEGTVDLNVELGIAPEVLKMKMEFVVVDIACVHNAILG